MANSPAVSVFFKRDILNGLHAFSTNTVARAASTTVDGFKCGLMATTGSAGSGTEFWSNVSAQEAATGGEYAAGGKAFTWVAPATAANAKAFTTPSASISWTNVTMTTDAAVLYNTSVSNKVIATFTFSSQSVSGGTFTLTMPSNDATNGLLLIA
jgi:hypothetical protein